MALTPSSPNLLQFPTHSTSTATQYLLLSELTANSRFFQSPWAPLLDSSRKCKTSAISPIVLKEASPSRLKCFAKSTAEEEDSCQPETLGAHGLDDQSSVATRRPMGSERVATSLSDSLSLGIREPVYEVLFFLAFFLSQRFCVL